MSESLDHKRDFEDTGSAPSVVDASDLPRDSVRPPIDYSSPAAFTSSSWARWKSLWTRRFTLSLLAGQVVSLCITVTNVTTTELISRNWSLPTTQTWFLYCSLFLVYTPYTIYKYGLKGWGQMIYRDGWKYFILAASDVEGNFLVVKAYNYTDLLSCMLPRCLGNSCLPVLLLGVHAFEVSLDSGVGYPTRERADAFMIVGATLYGFTNATEEFFVRRSPLYEVVGQLGMWGTLINGIQAASLEACGYDHGLVEWCYEWVVFVGFLAAYTAAMFILYTVAPLLYRMASSPFYNISLLTSDFYGLLFGLFLFHYSPYWLYFPAFCVVVVGLIIYFWHATPEEQGKIEPQAPAYIRRMHLDDQV
ncbi:hypothetical protein EV424DRAFT_1541357 [Suillus variegatus]|nr:hypothetical protein EV424DRAFT_1541357 [Suillus variegatus]